MYCPNRLSGKRLQCQNFSQFQFLLSPLTCSPIHPWLFAMPNSTIGPCYIVCTGGLQSPSPPAWICRDWPFARTRVWQMSCVARNVPYGMELRTLALLTWIYTLLDSLLLWVGEITLSYAGLYLGWRRPRREQCTPSIHQSHWLQSSLYLGPEREGKGL